MNKTLISSIITALAFFLFFYLAMPQYDDIKVLKEAIKTRQTLLTERTTLLNKVNQLFSEYEVRQSEVSRITTFLPENKQLDEVVSSIQNITSQNGMQLTELTTSNITSANSGNYKKAFIGLNVTGSYPSFVNMLASMENSLRLYDIDQINADPESIGGNTINFTVKMNTYYLK